MPDDIKSIFTLRLSQFYPRTGGSGLAQVNVLAGAAMLTLSCSNSKQSFEELSKVTQIRPEIALADAI